MKIYSNRKQPFGTERFGSFAVSMLLGAALLPGCTKQLPDHYVLESPDGKLSIELSAGRDSVWTYSFTADQTPLIEASTLGFVTPEGRRIPAAGWTVSAVEERDADTVWRPVWGKRAEVPDRYREVAFELVNPQQTAERLRIVARAYDDGVAFRYEVPAEDGAAALPAVTEQTDYRFGGDYTAWFYNGEDRNIGPELLTETNGTRLPVMTVRAGDKAYMALHEAFLQEGDPLVLQSKAGQTEFEVVDQPDTLAPGYASAWRVVLYGRTPGELTDSHLIELLNPDPAPGSDFSWVKPGMAVWDWRINGAVWDGFTYTMSYPSWIRMVDFAAEQGFSYLVLDANWYGPEFGSDSHPTTGDKAKDVQRLIAYAKEKGVGIWLYLNDVGGRGYPIEETLRQYGEWGAAGVKYGFMSGSQRDKNPWTQKITRLCAENHLLVDFHDGPVHPYGQMRTWPNAVTREYCHAQLDGHHVFVPSTFVTSVFVNMVAGPLDMNNGMFDLRQGNTTRVDESQPVPSTLVAEAARTQIVFSGATILPDIPEYYRKYPSLLNFLSAQRMPWRESRTLAGEIGQYIVMMRQAADGAYLVGAATNEEARDVTLSLDFLGEGQYEAQITEDGDGAHYLTNREVLKTRTEQVTAADSLTLSMAPGGGACVVFRQK
ncbi:glycoside hydrolase family 97 protein [Millionella massiliensis]|uniref:glycoside hydrolase family 97 protein n=1 Tax=Millionella massiliensis TaxID=1871023 RepID=UPI0008DAB521|nr:glycoside hydrolase family 97 protein [Millionella massiliensis]